MYLRSPTVMEDENDNLLVDSDSILDR